MNHPSSNMWLTGDLHNMLRGLAAGAAAIPPGEYARGYQAALVAVGLAVGMEQDDRRADSAAGMSVVFDFARLGVTP